MATNEDDVASDEGGGAVEAFAPSSSVSPSSSSAPATPAPPAVAVAEDEYPAQPTLFYFLLKFALGALTFLVLAVAYWFKPYTCEGVCWVDPARTAQSCAAAAPKFIFYHPLPFGADESLVASFDSASRRKGFNVIALPESTGSSGNLVSVSRDSTALAETLRHIPWQLAVRGNHSLYIKPRLGSVVWAELGFGNARSLLVLRNPLERLKEWFEESIQEVPESLFLKATSKSRPEITFELCALDPKCRSVMGLRGVCQEQTRLVCGSQCVGDDSSAQDRIARAKAALGSRQTLAGYAEDLPALSAVLRRTLPTFFEFVSIAPAANKYAASGEWSAEVQDVLYDLCAEDLAVYAEAVRVFGERAQECQVTDVCVPPVVERLQKETTRSFFSW